MYGYFVFLLILFQATRAFGVVCPAGQAGLDVCTDCLAGYHESVSLTLTKDGPITFEIIDETTGVSLQIENTSSTYITIQPNTIYNMTLKPYGSIVAENNTFYSAAAVVLDGSSSVSDDGWVLEDVTGLGATPGSLLTSIGFIEDIYTIWSRFSIRRRCTKCDVDTYQNNTGQQQCIACDERYATSVRGEAACTVCLPGFGGYLCEQCPSGTYSDIKTSLNCTDKACPAGEGLTIGQTLERSLSIDEGCVACEEGYLSEWEDNSECEACPNGTSTTDGLICYKCAVGKFKFNNTCQDCAPGEYQDTEGKDVCTSCPVGRYTTLSGAHECLACAGGKSSDQDGTGCTDCPQGNRSYMGEACTDCETGYDCPIGTYFLNACEVGFRIAGDDECDILDVTCSDECHVCLFNEIMITNCTVTVQTKCQACGENERAVNNVCEECPSGTILSLTTHNCHLVCEEGKADNGSQYCEYCAPGSYKTNDDCIACPSATPYAAFNDDCILPTTTPVPLLFIAFQNIKELITDVATRTAYYKTQILNFADLLKTKPPFRVNTSEYDLFNGPTVSFVDLHLAKNGSDCNDADVNISSTTEPYSIFVTTGEQALVCNGAVPVVKMSLVTDENDVDTQTVFCYSGSAWDNGVVQSVGDTPTCNGVNFYIGSGTLNWLTSVCTPFESNTNTCAELVTSFAQCCGTMGASCVALYQEYKCKECCSA